MQNMTCNNKSFMTKRKAFTLIELLIVIAIIGILFIVLISKVDFATDKSKATGVQTDFRSFQMAFETVAKENAGFNTFGWDMGDLNANGKRDSYDEGDTNKDNIQDPGEIWTGHKVPGETFTKVFTLVKPGTTFATDGYDIDAISKLETAINANLDPKLHITIGTDGKITMANGAKDPWDKEYHGEYITNAEVDKKDQGAIVIYSDGANNEFGSEHTIANGIVSISVPGDNKAGKDDYSMAVVYTYVNGHGEVKTSTSGFSQNQNNNNNGASSNNGNTNLVDPNDPNVGMPDPDPDATLDSYSWYQLKELAAAKLSREEYEQQYGLQLGQKKEDKYVLVDFDGNDYGGFVFMYDTGLKTQFDSDDNRYYFSDILDVVSDQYENFSDPIIKGLMNCVTVYSNWLSQAEVDCMLFVPSATEIGLNYSSQADDGILFDYFKKSTLRQNDQEASEKRMFICNQKWWTRSAYEDSYPDGVYVVLDNGVVQYAGETSNCQIVLAFVIGQSLHHGYEEDYICDHCSKPMCQLNLDHRDNNLDSRCDGCKSIWCVETGIHATLFDSWSAPTCDWCRTKICGNYESHNDLDDGYCDRCNAVYCEESRICHDDNNNGLCDWCLRIPVTYEWDENCKLNGHQDGYIVGPYEGYAGYDGYCDNCGVYLRDMCDNNMHRDGFVYPEIDNIPTQYPGNHDMDGYCDFCFEHMCTLGYYGFSYGDGDAACDGCYKALCISPEEGNACTNNIIDEWHHMAMPTSQTCSGCNDYMCKLSSLSSLADYHPHKDRNTTFGQMEGIVSRDQWSDGICDVCNEYLCAMRLGCWDYDHNGYCDCCGAAYVGVCAHRDMDNDYYCDYCSESSPDAPAPEHPTEVVWCQNYDKDGENGWGNGICDICNNPYLSAPCNHVDTNGDGLCDGYCGFVRACNGAGSTLWCRDITDSYGSSYGDGYCDACGNTYYIDSNSCFHVDANNDGNCDLCPTSGCSALVGSNTSVRWCYDYDNDHDNICDICNNQYRSAPCIHSDTNGDGICDNGCLNTVCGGPGSTLWCRDTNWDNSCDACNDYLYLSSMSCWHLDRNNDGRCDNCPGEGCRSLSGPTNKSWCYNTDANNDNICDVCNNYYPSAPCNHLDNTGDGKCDSCGQVYICCGAGATLFCRDADYNQECDLCSEYYYQDWRHHVDIDGDGACDDCPQTACSGGKPNSSTEASFFKSVTISVPETIVSYQFIPNKSGTYTFYSTGSSDSQGYIYDSFGQQLYFDDDSGEGYNFSMSCDLTAGVTYELRVRLYSSNTGSFDIYIR